MVELGQSVGDFRNYRYLANDRIGRYCSYYKTFNYFMIGNPIMDANV